MHCMNADLSDLLRLLQNPDARVRSGVQTRTDVLGAVKAGSVEKLIRTTNARLRRAMLPRSGSGWRIRGGLGR